MTSACLASAAMLLVACSDGGGSAPSQAADPQEQSDMVPARVAAMTVQPRRVVVYDELPGRVAALRTAEIRPQVSGIIRKVLFKEGSEVTAGQPLFQIDPAPFAADVDAASAVLARAEADLTNASLKHKRIQTLADTKTATAAALGDANAALAQARASVAEAQANLARRKLELGNATIRSPISGRIGQALISEGGLASPGSSAAMAVVQQIDRIFLDVRQSSMRREMLEDAIAHGQVEDAGDVPVDIRTIADKPYEFQGRILFSESTVDPGTGSVAIRVEVPNPHRQLLPGMYLRARVPRFVYAAALTLPQQAIRRDATGRAQLTIVGPDGAAVSREVELGPLVKRDYVILSGLKAGETVVVEGQERAVPGQRLEAVTYQPAASKT